MATNYTIQKGDTLSQIAQNYGTTTQELMRLNPSVTNPNLIKYGQSINIPTTNSSVPPPTPTTSPITPTIDVNNFGSGSALNHPLYTPASNANDVVTTYLDTANTTYNQSLQQQQEQLRSVEENQRKAQEAMDKALADRKSTVDTEKANAETEQAKILNNVNEYTQPFREEYENSQRAALEVNTNYQENQKLTNELGTLLQEGNDLIAQMKGVTGLASIRNPRISQSIEAVNARVGVIQAVMSARNNQISVATNLIDRGLNAMNADRQDRLNYYSTLLELNDKKLVSLSNESKELAYTQLSQIQSKLDTANRTADYIKELMISPESASFIANAGVTLNDTVEEINAKMAKYSNQREIESVILEYTKNGYQNIPYQASGAIPVDVNGKTLYFKPPVKTTSSTSSSTPVSAMTTVDARSYLTEKGTRLTQGERDNLIESGWVNIPLTTTFEQVAQVQKAYPDLPAEEQSRLLEIAFNNNMKLGEAASVLSEELAEEERIANEEKQGNWFSRLINKITGKDKTVTLNKLVLDKDVNKE